jgi:hypothetical protein
MLVAKAHLAWPWATLWLDGFFPGVVLPESHRNSSMCLQIGRGMPLPIPDLVCDEEGIGGTLTFDGQHFQTWIPWAAVYAIGSRLRQGYWSWLRDMDAETRSRVSKASYSKALSCPACRRAPFAEVWLCDGCEKPIDPFAAGPRCEGCGHLNQGVQCLGCGKRFAIRDWGESRAE